MLKVFVIEFRNLDGNKHRSKVSANDRDEALDVLREEYGLAEEGEGNPFTLVREEQQYKYEGSATEIETEVIEEKPDYKARVDALQAGISAVIRAMSLAIYWEKDDRNMRYHLALKMSELRRLQESNGMVFNNILGKMFVIDKECLYIVYLGSCGVSGSAEDDVMWITQSDEELRSGKMIDLKIMGLIE